MSTHDLTATHRCPLYPVFHPWSEEIPAEDKCCYWVSFLVISLLTAFVVPLLFYLAYYLVRGCCCLSDRVTPESESSQELSQEESLEEVESQEEVSKEEFTFQANTPPLVKTLLQEIEQTKQIDSKANNPRWLKFEPDDQSFETFVTRYYHEPDNRPLYIQLIGTFSKSDMKVVHQMMEFLTAFHHLEVHLVETVLSMEEAIEESGVPIASKQREWDSKWITQYLSNDALSALYPLKKKYAPKEAHYICFTSEHLYEKKCTNFVFGLGHYGGTGIFSNFMFGDPKRNFQEVLQRMMKISAHEFGHMYRIGHCSKHKCNGGGYMTLGELDDRPFYYCSKDTAKLCLLKGITLKEYYTDLLSFFEKFQTKHSTDIFKEDIIHVKKKLKALST